MIDVSFMLVARCMQSKETMSGANAFADSALQGIASLPENSRTALDHYVRQLTDTAAAEDLQALISSHQALCCVDRDAFLVLLPNNYYWKQIVLESGVITKLIAAIAHVISLVPTDTATTCVLQQDTASCMLYDLGRDLCSLVLTPTFTEKELQDSELHQQMQQMARTGADEVLLKLCTLYNLVPQHTLLAVMHGTMHAWQACMASMHCAS